MPAKTPIYLKPNSGKYSSGNGKGGKKLRELLSAEMISLPLGDFRHMAHVGRGGSDDMFGDTTFLNMKNSNDPTTKDELTESQGEDTQSQRKVKAIKKQRNNSVPDSSQNKQEAKSLSNHSSHCYGPLDSPILQSAFSLPLLPQQSLSTSSSPAKDDTTRTTNRNKQISQSKAKSHETGLHNLTSTPNGISNGPPKPRRLIVEDGITENEEAEYPSDPCMVAPQTARSIVASPIDTTSIDEGWALELDLGTSLMDDVMGIMEKIEI